MSLNKIFLLGRLTADPEVKYTNSGKAVAQFTLAVNRPSKDATGNYESDFINIVAWNKTAETVGNHVTKGQRLLVEGRLQIRSYEAKDGSKRYVTEVIANSMDFIEKKSDGAAAPAKQSANFGSFGDAQPFNEEIPF